MATTKHKILVVGGFPGPGSKVIGGIVTSCQALLGSDFSNHFQLLLVDSTQVSNPAPSFAIRSVLAGRRFMLFLRILFSARPDAVLLFVADGASVAEKGLMACFVRVLGRPALIFPRATSLISSFENSALQRLWISIALRSATHFLCQGPAWRDFAMKAIGFSKEQCPIIRNWTATESLLSIGASRGAAGSGKNPTLLFLGWLEEEKGIFDLLEAILLLVEEFSFELKIAGRGRAEEAARSFVKFHRLDDVIEFCGWVDVENKEILLGEADILVLPSWSEGFPNVIVEAMAAKVAVVATTVGTVPDLIADEQQALLVAPRDIRALERAIARLLEDSKFRIELGERGHEFARDKFSLTNEVAKLTSVIDAAIVKNRDG